MRSSVTATVQPHLASVKIAPVAWELISKKFGATSAAHVRSLRQKIHDLKHKPNTSITDYLLHATTFSNSLATAGVIISDEDLIEQVLHGLGLDYKEFLTSYNQHPASTFDDFSDRLLYEETLQNRFSSLNLNSGTTLLAHKNDTLTGPNNNTRNTTHPQPNPAQYTQRNNSPSNY